MRVYIVGIPYGVERGYVRDRALGEIDHVRQTITIEEDLEYDQTVETLLHEIVHGIEYAMSIDLKDSDVFCISRGLYSVLTDPLNEGLWAALAGSDEIMDEKSEILGGEGPCDCDAGTCDHQPYLEIMEDDDDVDDSIELDEEVVEADPAGYTRSDSSSVP